MYTYTDTTLYTERILYICIYIYVQIESFTCMHADRQTDTDTLRRTLGSRTVASNNQAWQREIFMIHSLMFFPVWTSIIHEDIKIYKDIYIYKVPMSDPHPMPCAHGISFPVDRYPPRNTRVSNALGAGRPDLARFAAQVTFMPLGSRGRHREVRPGVRGF
jgi:hypothetical protein